MSTIAPSRRRRALHDAVTPPRLERRPLETTEALGAGAIDLFVLLAPAVMTYAVLGWRVLALVTVLEVFVLEVVVLARTGRTPALVALRARTVSARTSTTPSLGQSTLRMALAPLLVLPGSTTRRDLSSQRLADTVAGTCTFTVRPVRPFSGQTWSDTAQAARRGRRGTSLAPKPGYPGRSSSPDTGPAEPTPGQVYQPWEGAPGYGHLPAVHEPAPAPSPSLPAPQPAQPIPSYPTSPAPLRRRQPSSPSAGAAASFLPSAPFQPPAPPAPQPYPPRPEPVLPNVPQHAQGYPAPPPTSSAAPASAPEPPGAQPDIPSSRSSSFGEPQQPGPSTPATPPPGQALRQAAQAQSSTPSQAADLPPAMSPSRRKPGRHAAPASSMILPTDPISPAPSERRYLVVLPGGRSVRLEKQCVLGRAPSRLTDEDVQLITLEDPTPSPREDQPQRALSRNHLRLGHDDSGLWAEDLNSTNGSVVVHSTGLKILLEPGQHTPLSPDSVIVLAHALRISVVAR